MLNQKTAVVTGASSGFGRLTAEALAENGWRVYGALRDSTARNADAAASLRAAGVTPIELDVTSDASVDAAARRIHDEAGAVDVLVNNAGTAFFGIQEAFTPAAVERQFATNVIGPLRVNRAFLPAMRERRSGLIVYVSSTVGRYVLPFAGVYTASKWALEASAEASYWELAPLGIDVAIVEPGAYPTEITGKFAGPDDAARISGYGEVPNIMESLDAAFATNMKGRDPREVSDVILQLANAPAGARALRTPVPDRPLMQAINDAASPLQRQMLEAFGLGELLAKTPA